MRIPHTLRRLRAALRGRSPRPAILMYHRVVFPRKDPWDIAVNPELFKMQMAYLHRHRTPMFVDELIERLHSKTLPADAVAVTFDDGYLDNLLNAKPALVKYKVPATVFVATGFTGQDMPFWWDELAGMILEAAAPIELKVNVQGETLTLAWGQLEPADADSGWRGWDAPHSARQASYVEVWSKLQSATQAERASVLEALRVCLQAPADPLSHPMTAMQLKYLVAGDLVRLGGHTISHRALTDLDRTTSRFEIRESGEQCRAMTGQPVNGFAYPYGNFEPEVCDDVAQSNLLWACTTEAQFLDKGDINIFALPRIAVTNLSMRFFKRILSA